jgi:hypothetical protein
MPFAAALRGASPGPASAPSRDPGSRAAKSRGTPRSAERGANRHAPSPSQRSGLVTRAVVPRAEASNDSEDSSKDEELDFITRVVLKVFGQDALSDPEPMGLKRMSKEEWPDQWPARCDGTAAELLVSDDTEELRRVRPLLKQTQLEKMPLGIAYDATAHGWKASSFHTQCDGQGAAVMIAESTDGVFFGAYNPKGWLGYGEWLDAISAFLFVYPSHESLGAPVDAPFLKLGKCGGSGMAIIDENGEGPKWGPDGLRVDLETRTARSRLGSYYAATPDGGKSLFGTARAVGLKSLRIYVALEDSELAKNYEPNAFQWKKGELEKVRAKDSADGGGSGKAFSFPFPFPFPFQRRE